MLKLIQTFSNKVKTCTNLSSPDLYKLVQSRLGQDLSELVRICPNFSELVWTCQPTQPSLSEFALTSPNLSELVQICPNLSELVQTWQPTQPSLLEFAQACPNMPKIVWTCPNLSSHSAWSYKTALSAFVSPVSSGYLLNLVSLLRPYSPDMPVRPDTPVRPSYQLCQH